MKPGGEMQSACERLAVVAVIAAVLPVAMIATASAASGDEIMPVADFISQLGPVGVIGYVAYVIGRAGGLPITVRVQLDERDRQALESTSRLTVIHRTKEQAHETHDRGGFHGD